jgi:anti-sigma regulatory factor (Ser/Thr protein kinase)
MSAVAAHRPARFQHEVLVYEGAAQFTDRLLPYVHEGLDLGEAVLVVVTSDKIALLAGALGRSAGAVRFAPMEELGRNPARIIPAWRAFLDEHAADGRGVRGVGEPIFAGRGEAELDECHRHEALLNTAFQDSGGWRLVCPYDVRALDPSVVKQAHANHPLVTDDGPPRPSESFQPLPSPFEGDLPDPPRGHVALTFTTGALVGVRRLVGEQAALAGLDAERVADALLAVNEIATNSLRHGAGHGLLRVWREPGALVCQVSDEGRIADPLVGRRRPGPERRGGRGVWLANQVCDLVQIRSGPHGTHIRLRVSASG